MSQNTLHQSSRYADGARVHHLHNNELILIRLQRDFAPNYSKIPPHGRWQHFEVGGVPRVEELLSSWTNIDMPEKTRRLLDLFLVSVLLDAGAGSKWGYRAKDGKTYKRSEGLAVASLEMFNAGAFSSDPRQPQRVDGPALKQLTPEIMREGMQVTEDNPMDGLEGRTDLLVKLGEAMDNQTYFGDDGRPGAMLGKPRGILLWSFTDRFRLFIITPIDPL